MEEFGQISPHSTCKILTCLGANNNKVADRKPISVLNLGMRASVMKEEKIEELSPRGVLENSTSSLESDTDSSKASSSGSDRHSNSRARSRWRGFLQLFRSRSIRQLPSLLPPVHVPTFSKCRARSLREKPATPMNLAIDSAEAYCFKSSWKNFTSSELQAATNNFNSENVIGKGGYAEVYKGRLKDGQLVAIKRLARGTQEERIGDFLSEIGAIVHVNHPNTARLIGYGVEGGLHLILELSPRGSLASLLHGSEAVLDWKIRYKVALGTAEGLKYLHEGCKRRIIHRDIKSANILLTEDYEPKITDFGFAKWLPEEWSHHTFSKFEGTFGYLAPEYLMHGIVDEKIDVYAFGVLLLELITGRQALDNRQQSLVMWAKPLLDKKAIREIVDPSLADIYDSQQMNRVALTASLCIQPSSISRPRMSQVVCLLRGDEPDLRLNQSPLLQRTNSEKLFEAEEYNSTRYKNDLNRHKQLALEL